MRQLLISNEKLIILALQCQNNQFTCDTFFGFCTAYGYDKYGENTSFIRVEIKQLNETDGRVVYVTETGEKYHFSETCAGEYAIATTYLDATGAGYEPCGKCAD